MRLKSISYVEHEGKPKEWSITNVCLGSINLIAGRNATGKTRTLNVITGLARLVSGESRLTYTSGNYSTEFEHDGMIVRYDLEYQRSKILRELLQYGNKKFLDRGKGGIGKIFAQEVKKKGSFLKFQTPENELAVVVRRDSLQHRFFEPLYQWGKSLLRYDFGGGMGHRMLATFGEEQKAELETKDAEKVVLVYKMGISKFGKQFQRAVISDMANIGYELEDIGLRTPPGLIPPPGFPGEISALYVKESSLQAKTDQYEMSQGMFRALSILIHLNYSRLSSKASSILIDDIGEGLDFDRSCRLIEVLMEKAQKSKVQLIMATNDRFVMNKVPLEAWSLIVRDGSNRKVLNYSNSKKLFDEFKFTGLNNFDFLAVGFQETSRAK